MAQALQRVRSELARRRRPLLRAVIVVLALWLLYLAGTAWGVPRLVRSVIVHQVPQALGRQATVGNISFDPFRLRLRIHDLAILDQAGKTPDFSVAQVEVNASISSLFRLAPVVDSLTVVQPRLAVVREGPREFSFSDILQRLDARPASPGSGLPRFSLNNLSLHGGEVSVDDKVTGRQHTVRGLEVGIPFLSTLSYATEIDVQPKLAALINGSPFALGGTVRPFDTPRSSSLHIKLDDFGLDALADAIPGAVPVQLRHARLDTDANLVFQEGGTAPPAMRLEGQAALRDVDVRAGSDPLLAFKRLALERFTLEPLAKRFHVARITLAGPELWAARDADGQINLARVAAQFGQPAPAVSAATAVPAGAGVVQVAATDAPPANGSAGTASTAPAVPVTPVAPAPAGAAPASWSVAVDDFTLQDGKVDWHDATVPFDYQVSALSVDVSGLALPGQAGQATTLKLTAQGVGDARIEVAGPVRIQPMAADLEVKLDGVGLPALAPLWKPYLALNIDSGVLAAGAKVHVEQGDAMLVRWSEGRVQLDKLRAAPAADKASGVQLDKLEVSGLQGGTDTRSAQIARVAIDGMTLAARRAANHDIGWAAIVPATPAAKPPAPPPADGKPAAPWKVGLDTLALNQTAVRWTDAAVSPQAQFRLDNLAFEARHLGSDLAAPVEFTLKSAVQGKGALNLAGTLVPQPLSVKAQVRATRINLTAFAPYLAGHINASVNSVVVGADGRAEFAAATPRQPQRASWLGSAEVGDLQMTDKVNASDFLRWKRLAFKRLSVRTAGDALNADLGDISLEDFFARAVLNEQGRLNLSQVVAQPGEEVSSITAETAAGQAGGADRKDGEADARTNAKGASVAPVPASGPGSDTSQRRIRVGQVAFARGQVNFTDNFVKPNYRVNLTGVDGTISAVSSYDPTPADVHVSAKVDGDAPVEITGKLQVLGPRLYTDITASAQGIELPALTPYSAKYAGYAIERGKLSMDVHYQIEDGKLQATNKIFLDQLTFGDRVESPSALNLPVQLAVALLKDRNGQINIELPISGSLDDPQFSVGSLIVRVLVNLITRAVTAPFSLLASAFGSGEELSNIGFEPGSAALDDDARKRVDTLVKALNDRPGLKLDVAGRANTALDADGLRKRGVQALIRAQQRKDLKQKADDGGDDAGGRLPVLDAQQRARYLEAAYKEAKLENKPRNVLGLAKSIPEADMESLLEASIPVGPDQLRALAVRRAQAVTAVMREAKLSDRVFLTAPKVEDKASERGKVDGADFSLK